MQIDIDPAIQIQTLEEIVACQAVDIARLKALASHLVGQLEAAALPVDATDA